MHKTTTENDIKRHTEQIFEESGNQIQNAQAMKDELSESIARRLADQKTLNFKIKKQMGYDLSEVSNDNGTTYLNITQLFNHK